MKKDRINSRILQVPVLNEFGHAVALWCSIPCDKEGNIDTPSAIKHNGLNKSNIDRIMKFNQDMNDRFRIIEMLNKPVKITSHMRKNQLKGVEEIKALNQVLNNPKRKTLNPAVIALSQHAIEKREAKEQMKMIET